MPQLPKNVSGRWISFVWLLLLLNEAFISSTESLNAPGTTKSAGYVTHKTRKQKKIECKAISSVDKENVRLQEQHMWLMPHCFGGQHRIIWKDEGLNLNLPCGWRGKRFSKNAQRPENRRQHSMMESTRSMFLRGWCVGERVRLHRLHWWSDSPERPQMPGWGLTTSWQFGEVNGRGSGITEEVLGSN